MSTPSMYDQITAAQIIKRQRAEQGPPPTPPGVGAIAYSPSTGIYGWATHRYRREDAEYWALARCYDAARRSGRTRQDLPTDVAVMAWGRYCMLSLAVNDRGGYGAGAGPTARKAKRAARRQCGGKATVILCLWTAAPEPPGSTASWPSGAIAGHLV